MWPVKMNRNSGSWRSFFFAWINWVLLLQWPNRIPAFLEFAAIIYGWCVCNASEMNVFDALLISKFGFRSICYYASQQYASLLLYPSLSLPQSLRMFSFRFNRWYFSSCRSLCVPFLRISLFTLPPDLFNYRCYLNRRQNMQNNAVMRLCYALKFDKSFLVDEKK